MKTPSVLARPCLSLIILFGMYGLLAAAGCSTKDTEPGAEEGLPAPTPLAVPTPDTTDVEVHPTYAEAPASIGWVTAITLNVRRGPGTGSGVIGYLFKGDRVEIYDEQRAGGTWYQINDASGYVDGWISARFVSGQEIASGFIIPDDYKAPRTPTVSTSETAQYVGVRACRTCHSEPHGDFRLGAYGIWRDHYHAEAYRTLARPYARAQAQRRGIDDPTTDWRCLKCHVTAYGVAEDRLGPNYRDEEGVTCEACHGPGGDYLEDHWEGTEGFASREARGFRIYRNIDEREQVCRSCHNELSPTYKPFNVAAFSEAIRHWGADTFQEIAREEDVAEVPPPPVAPEPVEEPPDEPTETEPPPEATPEEPPPAPETPPDEPVEEQPVETPPVEEPPVAPPPVAPPPVDPPPPPPTRDEPRLLGSRDMMLGAWEGSRRGVVYFPHHDHAEYVTPDPGGDACQVCHHTTEPGETPELCGNCHKFGPAPRTPSREKAFHGSCRACHREVQLGPKRCSECHSG